MVKWLAVLLLSSTLALAGCAAPANQIFQIQSTPTSPTMNSAQELSETTARAAQTETGQQIFVPLVNPAGQADGASVPPKAEPVTVTVAESLPTFFVGAIARRLIESEEIVFVDRSALADSVVTIQTMGEAAHLLAERYYAAVVPFATVQDEISLADLQARWQGAAPLLVSEESAEMLNGLWGNGSPVIVPAGEIHDQLLASSDGLAILPFELIDPEFKVLRIDGVNPLDNHLDARVYPLAVAIGVTGDAGDQVAGLLQDVILPYSNRDASQLTTLIMTGVTAMSRGTAAAMEYSGYAYPAAIISATLAAADITHVSNEVPFIDGCVVNNTSNNLTLCSDYTYWAALEAIGTDFVGLSGNHVNDFGRDGARESLQFYRDNQIPIYGSGLTIEEACAPLLWEHNGNTFAFIAALAFGPEFAWVTDELPGACYYYDHKEAILAAVTALSQEVDVVSVELQYLETYNPYPTDQQVIEFREVREAGADLVTGVQSHVPQAMEPYGRGEEKGPGTIVYGLGNLFFDQMWSWETRTELYARHTIYAGQVINTEILTGVLENFAQPRWATDGERAEILNRIFQAAPAR